MELKSISPNEKSNPLAMKWCCRLSSIHLKRISLLIQYPHSTNYPHNKRKNLECPTNINLSKHNILVAHEGLHCFCWDSVVITIKPKALRVIQTVINTYICTHEFIYILRLSIAHVYVAHQKKLLNNSRDRWRYTSWLMVYS